MGDWKHSLDDLSSNSLLVSTPGNTLIRFYCPIPAKCIQPVAGYHKNQRVFIDGVYQEGDQLMYLIDELKLPHRYFTLTV